MKKYVKPELYYESFELSQHIAGCEIKLLAADAGACTATGTILDITLPEDGSGRFFIGGAPCTVEVEAYCYTNGAMSIATINS